VVEREFSGAARVTGGAGTGKTIVAVHRAVHLWLKYSPEPILLTTYTRRLAEELRRRVEIKVGEIPDSLEISTLDSLVKRLLMETHPQLSVKYEKNEVEDYSGFLSLYKEIKPNVSQRTAWDEWEHIIDPWNIQTLNQYLSIKRIGRRTPLSPERRKALFPLFERMREELKKNEVCTGDQACYLLAEHFRHAGPPFRCVIADEAQDFGPAQMTLVKALVPENMPDNLFFCADSAQRIYRRHAPWLQVGIDVRGRSTHLRVNYRNTVQIYSYAENVLPQNLEGADETDTQDLLRRPIPCLSGDEPECHACEDLRAQQQRLKEWLRRCLHDDIHRSQIGILARTKSIAEEVTMPVFSELQLPYYKSWENRKQEDFEVWVGTVHSAKGLEFRGVAVVGVDNHSFPLWTVIKDVKDPGERNELLNQERQLLHTALTRARERLFVSWVGQRSPFLNELK
ncbi:MAG: 3'-5' exonuclease, partial [Candidatus Caldarchaeum sp.]